MRRVVAILGSTMALTTTLVGFEARPASAHEGCGVLQPWPAGCAWQDRDITLSGTTNGTMPNAYLQRDIYLARGWYSWQYTVLRANPRQVMQFASRYIFLEAGTYRWQCVLDPWATNPYKNHYKSWCTLKTGSLPTAYLEPAPYYGQKAPDSHLFFATTTGTHHWNTKLIPS